jgi:anti-sigma B factor antagonist
MQLEDREEGNVLIVKILNQRLDVQGVADFKEKMAEYISNGRRLIVLNISDVEFVDSSGLGAMVSVLKLLKADGRLVICATREPVMRMFKLTRMNKVFNMYERERQAIDVLSQ